MKNFNNRFYLQSFITSTFKRTAIVKLCLPAGRQEDIPARPAFPIFSHLPFNKGGEFCGVARSRSLFVAIPILQ